MVVLPTDGVFRCPLSVDVLFVSNSFPHGIDVTLRVSIQAIHSNFDPYCLFNSPLVPILLNLFNSAILPLDLIVHIFHNVNCNSIHGLSCSDLLTSSDLLVSTVYSHPQLHGIEYTTPNLDSGGGFSFTLTSSVLSVCLDIKAVLMVCWQQVLAILSLSPFMYGRTSNNSLPSTSLSF